MTNSQSNESAPRKPLRLWPGVVIAVATAFVSYVFPLVAAPDATLFGWPASIASILGGVAGGLLIALWWLLFSRAPWVERLGVIALMPVAVFATSFVVDASIANAGMGRLLYILSIPVMGLALVAAAAVGRRLANGPRRVLMVAAILLTCVGFTLIRTAGVTGEFSSDLHWRWTPTPEDRLLAQEETAARPPAPPAGVAAAIEKAPAAPIPAIEEKADKKPEAAAAAPLEPAPVADWPGFRGTGRDSVVRGSRIDANWSVSPPVELWRRPIGPGWSSFAVDGDVLYTQEQRGEEEMVAAYNVKTGEPVWHHRDPVRFWESNGGAGPRGTPTLSNGRVYSLGATGILNVLNAATGAVIWSRNASTDTGVPVPDWGISSSPVVIDDLVITAVSGALVAYDTATGTQRWVVKSRGGSYSSPHLTTIDGVPQILLQSGFGATSVAPGSGMVLWEHAWAGFRIVQPAALPDGVIVTDANAGGGTSVRRLAVTRAPGGWKVEERWTSIGLKPYFNDFVVHDGYAYGFDGSILSSIDLADGARKWKNGRYGHGQLVLLPDQDLLLVVSEEGELALVGATPGGFVEHARFKALEGKTWNHPVLVNGVLLVRNGEEMAAFRLPRANGE